MRNFLTPHPSPFGRGENITAPSSQGRGGLSRATQCSVPKPTLTPSIRSVHGSGQHPNPAPQGRSGSNQPLI